jgi:hypothetical protein
MIKQDLLNGSKYCPIITKGLTTKFKQGYIRVQIRNPTAGQLLGESKVLGEESIKVEDIANVRWKEASQKYKLQEGVEWHFVEGAYRDFTLVRCMADNPTGTVREEYFLKPQMCLSSP